MPAARYIGVSVQNLDCGIPQEIMPTICERSHRIDAIDLFSRSTDRLRRQLIRRGQLDPEIYPEWENPTESE